MPYYDYDNDYDTDALLERNREREYHRWILNGRDPQDTPEWLEDEDEDEDENYDDDEDEDENGLVTVRRYIRQPDGTYAWEDAAEK